MLDPFSGSSSTLVVAKKLGRSFLGFELSEDYARKGMARLADTQVGDRLVGADEPKVSAPATDSDQAKSLYAKGRKKSKEKGTPLLGFELDSTQ